MKITSFELSKKLKELGIKQASSIKWLILTTYKRPQLFVHYQKITTILNVYYEYMFEKSKLKEEYAAFTLDEILEMLPVYLKGHPCATIPEATADYELKFRKENNYILKGYSITYETWRCSECNYISTCNKHVKVPRYECENNPAEAAGQLLVWCIENGHVKLEE